MEAETLIMAKDQEHLLSILKQKVIKKQKFVFQPKLASPESLLTKHKGL